MIKVKLISMTRAWEKENLNSESATAIEPMTSRTPGGRSSHWATRTHAEQGHLTEFIWHASCILLGLAMSKSSWINNKWKDCELLLLPNLKFGKHDKDEIINMTRAWELSRFPSGTNVFSMSHALAILVISSLLYFYFTSTVSPSAAPIAPVVVNYPTPAAPTQAAPQGMR